jgi:hypothetical protein
MAAAGMYLGSSFWEFGAAEDQRLNIAVGAHRGGSAGLAKG